MPAASHTWMSEPTIRPVQPMSTSPVSASGEMVLSGVVQDQTAHRVDPRFSGVGHLRHADEPAQSLGLGGLVGSRIRVQGHAAGQHGRPVLGERQAEAGAYVCGVGLDEAVEQPRRLGQPAGLGGGEAPGQPAAVDVFEVQPGTEQWSQAPRQLVEDLAVAGQEPEPPQPALP